MSKNISESIMDLSLDRPLLNHQFIGKRWSISHRILNARTISRLQQTKTFPYNQTCRSRDKSTLLESISSKRYPTETLRPCTANTLWEDNRHLYFASLFNPFIQSMARGELPKRIFDEYISQDVQYLHVLAKSLSTVSELIPIDVRISGEAKEEARNKALTLLSSVETELSSVHESFVDIEKLPESSWATKSYVEFLKKVETDPSSSVAEILASLLPCFRLYAETARFLRDNVLCEYTTREDHPYFHWINEYASDEFWEIVESAEWIFDHATDLDAIATGKPVKFCTHMIP